MLSLASNHIRPEMVKRRHNSHGFELLSVAIALTFAPLAICWLYITGRELEIRVANYAIQAGPHKIMPLHFVQLIRKHPPRTKLGPIEVSQTHELAVRGSKGQIVTHG